MSYEYRGRFAPSPTGPLHLGSLIAALASYLDARANNGTWLVRIDDLDPPREIPGSAESILSSLQAHGLQWDEQILWQSRQSSAYDAALSQLATQGMIFACSCSRQALNSLGCCQNHCELHSRRTANPCALRLKVKPGSGISFTDALQGPQHWDDSEQHLSDFVVKRKDELYAYQLAVVVDDAQQKISHIVRGSDLLDSTPRQIYLQNALVLPTPHYTHLPVITNMQGQKYSKQNHAPALVNANATANLRVALTFLGQQAAPDALDTPASILGFAAQTWSMNRVPRCLAMEAKDNLAGV